MKKHVMFLLVTFMFLLAPLSVAAADSNIGIIIDGEKIVTDTSPIVSSNRVLVPVRVVSEELGFYVFWDAKTREVYLTKSGYNIKFNINQKALWSNGKEIELDVAPVIVNGRVFLPIRAISESTGSYIEWDGEIKSVIIQTNSIPNDNPELKADPAELTSIAQDGYSFKFQLEGEAIKEPKIIEMDNPQRLVIDFDNMVLASQVELSAITENPLVSGVRYSQYSYDPDKVRVVIDLKYKADYVYKLENNLFSIDLSPHVYNVVIDPGHGGKDPGAIGVGGYQEKSLNLAIAERVNNLFAESPYINGVMTRDSDIFISLDERVNLANKSDADLFIAIHANALPGKPNINGSETYYTKKDSKEFANILHKYLVDSTGFVDRGVRTADFRVTKYTKMPSVLLEVGYLTNSKEVLAMYNEDFQQRVAEGIVNAVIDYLDLENADPELFNPQNVDSATTDLEGIENQEVIDDTETDTDKE